jgi:hypothetical protein
MSLVAGSIQIELDAFYQGFEAGLRKAGKSVEDLDEKAQKLTNKGLENMNSKFEGVSNTIKTGLLVGIGGLVAGIGVIGKKALDSSAEMESFGLQLETAFGGNAEMAKSAQAQITKFAAKTPYDLGQVMDSFIKLKNLGLDPSERALTSYGNTASAMGKDLNQMIEAVADASTGEFERLKEFGIRSQREGENVKFTFQGVTTTVKNNSQEIQDYLLKIGETNFSGSMDRQATTFSGLMSTMVDSVNIKLAELANNTGFLEFSKNIVTGVTNIVNAIDLNKINEFGSNWQTTMQNTQTAFQPVYDFLKPSLDQLIQAFKDMLPPLIDFWNLISPIVLPLLIDLAKLFGVVVVGSIKIVIDEMTRMINTGAFLIESTNNLINLLKGFWTSYGGAITNIFNGVTSFLKGWIDLIVGVFTGDKGKIDGAFNTMLSGVNGIFKGVMDGVGRLIYDTINWIINFVTEKFNWLKGKAGEMANLVNNIKNSASGATNSISQNTGLSQDQVRGAIRGALPMGLGGFFADGGIVGGNSYTGDRVPIMTNSGEMVLNERQQATLFDIANGGQRGQATNNTYNITLGSYLGTERDKRQLARDLKDAFSQVMPTKTA